MNTPSQTLKSVLVSLSLALVAVTGFAACAAPVDSTDTTPSAAEERTGEAEDALSNQCCYSYYTCPDNGKRYDWYSGPSAYCFVEGATYLGTASTNCNNACVATCVNHTQTCYPIY